MDQQSINNKIMKKFGSTKYFSFKIKIIFAAIAIIKIKKTKKYWLEILFKRVILYRLG